MYVTTLPYVSDHSDLTRQTSARVARLVFIASERTNIISTEMLLSSSTFHSHFNSIKVRLKHEQIAIFDLSNLDFNSIKVRLKRGRHPPRLCCRLFQFHKGTIKTEWTEIKEIGFWKFQFHKGTIKTNDEARAKLIKRISIP